MLSHVAPPPHAPVPSQVLRSFPAPSPAAAAHSLNWSRPTCCAAFCSSSASCKFATARTYTVSALWCWFVSLFFSFSFNYWIWTPAALTAVCEAKIGDATRKSDETQRTRGGGRVRRRVTAGVTSETKTVSKKRKKKRKRGNDRKRKGGLEQNEVQRVWVDGERRWEGSGGKKSAEIVAGTAEDGGVVWSGGRAFITRTLSARWLQTGLMDSYDRCADGAADPAARLNEMCPAAR